MKITNEIRKSFLKEKLASNKGWSLKALVTIFENQTEDEQNSEATQYYNNVGFTGVDAQLLSSFAKQYLRYGRLSGKQMIYVYKKMPKYWRQILNVSDREKLDNLITNQLEYA